MRPGPKWHLYRNYIFLIPIFAVILIYHAGLVLAMVQAFTSHTVANVAPFGCIGRTVITLRPEASGAGIHRGDTVLALDGAAFRSAPVLPQRLAVPGEHRLAVTIAASRTSPPHTVYVPLTTAPNAPQSLGIGIAAVVSVLMSLVCAIVGVYVAAVLPYDVRALAVLGMMISVSQVVTAAAWDDFSRPLWGLAFEFHFLGVMTWSLWLVLFGLYFPHRFSWDVRRPARKWLVLAPLIVATAILSATAARQYFNFDAWPWLPVFDGRLLISFSITVFFACIFSKLHRTDSKDAKRRLRVLIAGSMAGLVPLGAFLVYESLIPDAAAAGSGMTLLFLVVTLFFFFPLSLAYAVLAERAMNLRVAIRQGVRYTLAKGSLRLLAACVITLVAGLLWNLTFGLHLDSKIRIGLFVAAVVVARYALRRTSRNLQASLDRRFFRDAYNAEKVLEELTGKVLSLVRQEDLLGTIVHRISETLHVPQIAILLEGNGMFMPAYALGVNGAGMAPSGLCLPAQSSTVDVLKKSNEPARVYFDRRDSWVHDLPDNEIGTLKQLHSQLLLPIGARGNLLGFVSLGPKLSEEPYSPSDVQLLSSVMAQTGLALENVRLTTAVAMEVAQRERLNREVEIAREVQERLFPQQLPAVAGIDYFGACRPALGVGGDYYDFLPLGDGQIGIAVGDVSGKGIAAALLMASLQASLRGQVMTNAGNLARLMMNVNQLVYDATPENRYATFFYGQFDVRTRALTYVNAGHNPPLVLRRTPEGETHVIRLDVGGPVVGLLPKAPYQQGTLLLEPGDVFVGYTDGISEAMNKQEDEWGEDQLIATVATCWGECATKLIPSIMRDADAFTDGAPQHDDMTLVVLKLLPQLSGNHAN